MSHFKESLPQNGSLQIHDQHSPRMSSIIAQLGDLYHKKSSELAACTRRIVELEAEIKEFKPMQIIQNFEAKLKEKQNTIDVLEKRILFLQKKQASGQTNSSSQQSGSVSSESAVVVVDVSASTSGDSRKDNPPSAEKKRLDFCDSPAPVESDREEKGENTHTTVQAAPAADSQKKRGKNKLPKSGEEHAKTMESPGKGNNQVADSGSTPKGGRKKNTALCEAPSETFQVPAKRGRKRKNNPLVTKTSNPSSDSDVSSSGIQTHPCIESGSETCNSRNEETIVQHTLEQQIADNVGFTFLKQPLHEMSHLICEKNSGDHFFEQQLLIQNDLEEEFALHELEIMQDSETNVVIISQEGDPKPQEDEKEIQKAKKVKEPQEPIVPQEPMGPQEPIVLQEPKEIQENQKPCTESLPQKLKRAQEITNRFAVGEKIDPKDFQIVCLRAVSGKMIEYYMNKQDENVYKKVSCGVIGKKLGHISEFGKFDNQGHLVLNS